MCQIPSLNSKLNYKNYHLCLQDSDMLRVFVQGAIIQKMWPWETFPYNLRPGANKFSFVRAERDFPYTIGQEHVRTNSNAADCTKWSHNIVSWTELVGSLDYS